MNYAAIARGAGIEAIRVEHPGDVVDGLKQALTHDGPFLLDVVTDLDALSIPPHISAAQVKGFAFAAGRTVLDGGVGKMIDLARANLRNIPRP
ncbi:thiamine pyrophosphate-dependent enzyme [Streptomyces althioticus]|uniref:thiamine pyrophosphate-dependent enzyme n=1 Tax=Streptomyces althioticus TaxID=83380 RepID=UPI003F541EF6